ncbi:MAG: hypothetical protein R6U50_03100 [Desulfobacterales bacterium]
MGELSILTPSGTRTLTWTPENEAETERVKQCFNQFLDEGYSAFHMQNGDGEGKKIVSFNARAEKIIMLPKIGGG